MLLLYFHLNLIHLRFKCLNHDTRNSGAILSLPELAFIERDVLALKFAHFLNLIEVNYEALLVRVTHLNAFTAEDSQVVRAIEMHDAHIVRDAEFII
jgi:hypothetical protein